MPGRAGWLVDLRGYPESPFEGSFELRPFGLATVRVHDAGERELGALLAERVSGRLTRLSVRGTGKGESV